MEVFLQRRRCPGKQGGRGRGIPTGRCCVGPQEFGVRQRLEGPGGGGVVVVSPVVPGRGCGIRTPPGGVMLWRPALPWECHDPPPWFSRPCLSLLSIVVGF